MTRRTDAGGGGMTGATGDLTPDDSPEAFEPGELREVADPRHHAEVTAAQGRHAPAQQGEVGDPGVQPEGGLTNLATRDAGYGSQHGLSPDDPAYRMETHPDAPVPEEADRDRPPRQGGDEVSDHEEHF